MHNTILKYSWGLGWVHVEINGALQLPKPARIRAIKELDGVTWVFIDGSKTRVEMEHLIVEQKGQGAIAKLAATPPTLDEEEAARPGTRKEVFALDDGDVVLTFPESLSATSFADLDAYLKVFIGKMKRRSGEAKKD